MKGVITFRFDCTESGYRSQFRKARANYTVCAGNNRNPSQFRFEYFVVQQGFCQFGIIFRMNTRFGFAGALVTAKLVFLSGYSLNQRNASTFSMRCMVLIDMESHGYNDPRNADGQRGLRRPGYFTQINVSSTIPAAVNKCTSTYLRDLQFLMIGLVQGPDQVGTERHR